MKSRLFCFILLLSACYTLHAQISPESCNVAHSDSCWHFTFEYNTPDIPPSDGMLVVTHLCTPDTCISSTTRHYQGKRYNKRYIKRYGNAPRLSPTGWEACTISIPETAINDTVYGITYCEYYNRNGCSTSCDTLSICMPPVPSMSCHRAEPARSIADHIATEHPYVKNISHYTPLSKENAGQADITPSIVRYTTNSSKLNPAYLQNAESIEELMGIIEEVLSDSTTTIEAIQFVGYTSSDGSEDSNKGLGYARAKAIRDHIKKAHHLPDSIFEIADGGRSNHRSPARRMACCTGIYYNNTPDSTALALNEIIDELINNPKPDYRKMIDELKNHKNDPRVLNLQGVIEYHRHHRHAAEKAFRKAAEMGDEQALVNLNIIENEKKR